MLLGMKAGTGPLAGAFIISCSHDSENKGGLARTVPMIVC